MKTISIVLFQLTYCFFIGLLIRLLIDPVEFFYIWLFVYFSSSLLWLIFGDRFLLYALRSRPIKGFESVKNLVDNCSCKYGNGPANIFFTNRFQGNLYVCHGFFGRPSLVVGKGFVKNLSDLELNEVIEMASENIKSGVARRHTLGLLSYLLLISIPSLTVSIASKVINKCLNYLGLKESKFLEFFLDVHFMPFLFLRDKYFQSLIGDDYKKLNKVRLSLLLKIGKLDSNEAQATLPTVVNNLSLYRASDVKLSEVILSR